MTQPAQSTANVTFGIVRIGEAMLALPAEVIREVVPRPATLLSLAAPSHMLCGAIELRHEAIPVINIADLCGQTLDASVARLIVIIRHENALMGILADAVADIATVKTGQIRPLLHGSGDAMITGTFMLGKSLVNLLDPAALFALHGVPHVHESAPAKVAERGQRLLSNVVFRVAGVTLCLPAHEVDGTEPESRILDTPIMTGDCEGIIHYHGMEVPLVDTVPALGLGWPPKRQRRAAAIVLRFPDKGLLGFRIDEVVDIARQDEGQICPVPPGIISEPGLYRGIYVNARDERVLVLDPEAIRAREGFAQYASLVKPIQTPGMADGRLPVLAGLRDQAAALGLAAQAPYLLANCGMDFATPVAMVSEVIALPDEARANWQSGGAFLCAITHRQRVVPIFALEQMISTPSGGDLKRASVLLVRLKDMTIGFAVNELHSIQRASQVMRGTRGEGLPEKLAEFDMVLLRRAGPPTWVPMIDLPALTLTLTGGGVAEAAPELEDVDQNWMLNLPDISQLQPVS